jgi:hypothetical protein
MNCFHLILPHVAKALEATYVSIEIAVVGAIIAWLQLGYAKKRDATLDARNQWEEIHKAMAEFRFRREILNSPGPFSSYDGGIIVEARAVEAFHALHMLKGELDRAPDSPLVKQISDFLNDNFDTEKWRAPAFTPGFDKLVHQVALKSR